VARELLDEVPARVRVYEGEPVGLIEEWDGADAVIVVDAVSSGAPPGTVHRLDARSGPIPAVLSQGSTHAFGLAATIELARALDRLPASLLVYGIEGERFAAGDELSAPVRAAVEGLAGELAQRLRRFVRATYRERTATALGREWVSGAVAVGSGRARAHNVPLEDAQGILRNVMSL
jgi:hydrogenase maturation protease